VSQAAATALLAVRRMALQEVRRMVVYRPAGGLVEVARLAMVSN